MSFNHRRKKLMNESWLDLNVWDKFFKQMVSEWDYIKWFKFSQV